ncbi:hypothetical protein M9458_027817, partial [Cirrhinus mrigala]
MPYGLSISPAVFQTFMNEVFREYLLRFVGIYIDDILIYSRNKAEHRQHVQQVLHKLREHQLFLKLEKCEFHQPSVQFLGYVISAEGVQMDQGKIQAIPGTVKELQRFLGFANFYRQFIRNYSIITAPLTSLQREVDASTTGIGAVLSQTACEPPPLHPCAYYSHKLTPAEQNYDVGNRELLAIKLALEECCHWLEGASHQFTILMTVHNHKNLQYLREAKRLNPRQARWALFFTRFNSKISYRPGTKNFYADALSHPYSTDTPLEPENIQPSDVILSPIIWDLENNIRHTTLQEPAPPECPEGKTYVPRSQRQYLLDTVHESPGSGHPGSRRTLSLLQARYWWPSMHWDTIRYVQSCSVCAMENWFHSPYHASSNFRGAHLHS